MAADLGRILSDISGYERLVEEGFDFAQPSVDIMGDMPERDFRDLKSLAGRSGVSFAVCPVPLPDEVQVTQRGFNLYVWTEYMKKALRRAADLGCGKIAWIDGFSRHLPVEGSTAAAREQVLQFLSVLASIASEFGMTVLIEPLGPALSNFLNTLDETAAFLSLVKKGNLGCSISFGELESIGAGPESLGRFFGMIGHVHLEYPAARQEPRRPPRTDVAREYEGSIRVLYASGYAGTVALPEDAGADDLTFCRNLWENRPVSS